jgi:hypothetical protein
MSLQCPRCWKSLLSGSNFCPRCGLAMVAGLERATDRPKDVVVSIPTAYMPPPQSRVSSGNAYARTKTGGNPGRSVAALTIVMTMVIGMVIAGFSSSRRASGPTTPRDSRTGRSVPDLTPRTYTPTYESNPRTRDGVPTHQEIESLIREMNDPNKRQPVTEPPTPNQIRVRTTPSVPVPPMPTVPGGSGSSSNGAGRRN